MGLIVFLQVSGVLAAVEQSGDEEDHRGGRVLRYLRDTDERGTPADDRRGAEVYRDGSE